jgi:predicted amidohydrolase
VPAAWVQGPLKEDQWVTLARARAIESTCYLLGSAQVGNVYCGRSLVVDPFGVVVASLGERPGIAVAEISAERIAEVRATVPSLRHRRFSVQLDPLP